MYRTAISIFASFLVSLIAAGSACAQIPTKGDIFFGYSYLSADQNSGGHANLNGWNGSVEGKVLPFVGIVADISGLYGSQTFPESCGAGCSVSVNASLHNVLFGPRLSIPIGKFTPFAEGFVGVSHVHGGASGFSDSHTAFSEALGGGIDYRIIHGLGWRFEGDFLQTRFFSTTQNNFRFSTGLVLNF